MKVNVFQNKTKIVANATAKIEEIMHLIAAYNTIHVHGSQLWFT